MMFGEVTRHRSLVRFWAVDEVEEESRCRGFVTAVPCNDIHILDPSARRAHTLHHPASLDTTPVQEHGVAHSSGSVGGLSAPSAVSPWRISMGTLASANRMVAGVDPHNL